MSAIFISHSSQDGVAAARLRDWLRTRGHSSIFLDFDPADGIPAGRSWERELYARLDACVAVVALCSATSMASKWCFHEVASARARRIPVFPVRIDDCTPIDLLADLQLVDLTVDRDEGLEGLWRGMLAAGIDPREIFATDAARGPYPGLATFEAEDAAVFFGREGAVRDALAELDRQRAQGASRAVLILGASGSGKSSLMRAGVLPRMAHEPKRWLALPPFEPQGALGPLPRLAQGLITAFEAAGHAIAEPLLDRLLAGEAEALVEMAERLRLAHRQIDAQLLLTIDQAEQLLEPEAAPHDSGFLAMLRTALERRASPVMVLATLRSDRLGAWQSHPALQGMSHGSVTVGPMPPEALRQVVQLPADRHGLGLEPGLVEAIVDDIGSNPDALPLLAFTLRELYEGYGREDRHLSVAEYREQLGGVARSIERRAEALFPAGLPAEREAALRRLFVGLARPVEDGGYVRRPVPWQRVEPAITDVVARFVDAHLLVSDRQGGDDTGVEVVRVAHEALFRVWPRLVGWLAGARQHHQAAERLGQAWQRWRDAGAPANDLLLRPGRELEEGRELLGAEDVAIDPALRTYVQASIRAHEAELAERERARAQAIRQQAQAQAARVEAAHQRRDRLAMWSRLEVEDGEATLGLLVAMTGLADARAEGEAGRDASTLRLEAALLRAILAQRERRILTATSPLNRAGFTPDERYVVTFARNGTAALWETATGALTRTFQGHAGQVLAGAFDPAGLRLVTVSSDHTARLFEVATGATFAILTGHDGAVLDVAWSPAGDALVTASADGTARLWTAEGEPRTTLRGHLDGVTCAGFSPDGRTVLSASVDGTARLWPIAPAGVPVTLRGHGAAIHRACFSPDGERVATASWDGTARLWSVVGGACLATMADQGGGVEVVAFDPAGERLVTAGESGTMGLWDGRDGAPLGRLTGHVGQVYDAGFAPDGRTLASVCDDGTLRLWDLATSAPLARSSGHAGAIWRQAFSPSGRSLVTAAEDGTARLWDPAVSRPRMVLNGHGGDIYQATFSPDGMVIATAAKDGVARLWPADRPSEPTRLSGHDDAIWHLAWTPDGERLVTASADGKARLWAAATGACLGILDGHRGWVGHVAVSPTGERIATCGEDASATLWEAGSGRQLRRLEGHRGLLRQVLFTPDGQRLITASDDGTARIWDPETGRVSAELGGHTDAVVAIAISPDGRSVATASLDHRLVIHDVETGSRRQILEGHRNQVWHVAFAPDGQRLLSAAHDNRAMIWAVASGDPLAVLVGHLGRVVDAAFDPAGRIVATASWDRTVRLWHAATGEHVATLRGHTDQLHGIQFAADGRCLVTAAADGTARLFELPVGPVDDWGGIARGLAPRSLSAAERRLAG